MNKKTHHLLGRIRQLGLSALLATGLASQAATPLYQGHTDIGIAYDQTANEWELHVHDEVNDVEFFPATDALLYVKYGAHGLIPAGAIWSFLGSTGGDTWILPKVEDANLLFLGFGAEEIADGTFTGNEFTLSLKSVTGPGTFAVYDTDAFGDPEVWFNSGDGISGADVRTLPSGAHSHINWAFSTPGDYTVFFEAAGDSVLNGATSSGDVAYSFHVEAVPEPGTVVIFGFGITAAMFAFLRRRRY